MGDPNEFQYLNNMDTEVEWLYKQIYSKQKGVTKGKFPNFPDLYLN